MNRADEQVHVIWDTDIGRDPDDFIAGCFLLSRPEIKLVAVTISPGDADQVALTRFLLEQAGESSVPVGIASGRKKGKKSVVGCHLKLMRYYDARMFQRPDGLGWEVIRDALIAFPRAELLTTGPLNNIGEFLKNTDIGIEQSVSMGGFYSASDTPDFKQEFNFNGCPWATRAFLKSDRFGQRLLVGKNLTHEVLYDDQMHAKLRGASQNLRPLALVRELMCFRSGTKKLHDPLAAVALVCPTLFQWRETMPVHRKNYWSSVERPGSGIWAGDRVDVGGFREVFLGRKPRACATGRVSVSDLSEGQPESCL